MLAPAVSDSAIRPSATAAAAEAPKAYTVEVVAYGRSYDVPVTSNTRISSVMREVVELAAAARGEENAPLGEHDAGLFLGNQALQPHAAVGTLPANAVLHFHTMSSFLATRAAAGMQHQQQVPQFYHPNQKALSSEPRSGSSPAGVSDRSDNPSLSYVTGQSALTPMHQQYTPHPFFTAQSPSPYSLDLVTYANRNAMTPTTAASGNPWGLEDRGPTVRVPIRSSEECPFYPLGSGAPGATPNVSIASPSYAALEAPRSAAPAPPIMTSTSAKPRYASSAASATWREQVMAADRQRRGSAVQYQQQQQQQLQGQQQGQAQPQMQAQGGQQQRRTSASPPPTPPILCQSREIRTITSTLTGAKMDDLRYVNIIVEVPEHVDQETVGGIGAHPLMIQTGGIVVDCTVGDVGMPLRRRLRVNRELPIGCLRELFGLSMPWRIVQSGRFVADERQSMAGACVMTDTVFAFVKPNERPRAHKLGGPLQSSVFTKNGPQSILESLSSHQVQPTTTTTTTTTGAGAKQSALYASDEKYYSINSRPSTGGMDSVRRTSPRAPTTPIAKKTVVDNSPPPASPDTMCFSKVAHESSMETMSNNSPGTRRSRTEPPLRDSAVVAATTTTTTTTAVVYRREDQLPPVPVSNTNSHAAGTAAEYKKKVSTTSSSSGRAVVDARKPSIDATSNRWDSSNVTNNTSERSTTPSHLKPIGSNSNNNNSAAAHVATKPPPAPAPASRVVETTKKREVEEEAPKRPGSNNKPAAQQQQSSVEKRPSRFSQDSSAFAEERPPTTATHRSQYQSAASSTTKAPQQQQQQQQQHHQQQQQQQAQKPPTAQNKAYPRSASPEAEVARRSQTMEPSARGSTMGNHDDTFNTTIDINELSSASNPADLNMMMMHPPPPVSMSYRSSVEATPRRTVRSGSIVTAAAVQPQAAQPHPTSSSSHRRRQRKVTPQNTTNFKVVDKRHKNYKGTGQGSVEGLPVAMTSASTSILIPTATRSTPTTTTQYTFKFQPDGTVTESEDASVRRSASLDVASALPSGKLRVTLQDPKDPAVFHFNVPVEPDCPVGIIRDWLRAGGGADDYTDEALFDVFCGEVQMVDDCLVTFEDATAMKNDCVFSIRRAIV